ncbi:hypothetical protein JCM10450v2_005821 [Rhodotorula kratochvilovae]
MVRFSSATPTSSPAAGRGPKAGRRSSRKATLPPSPATKLKQRKASRSPTPSAAPRKVKQRRRKPGVPKNNSLPFLTPDLFLDVLDHLAPPPPATAAERAAGNRLLRPLGQISRAWRREIWGRRVRNVLLVVRPFHGFKTQGEAWAAKRVVLAAERGEEVRSLVALRAGLIRSDSLRRLLSKMSGLQDLKLAGLRSSANLFTGSMVLRRLRIQGSFEPSFSGVYSAVTHLVLDGARGSSLPAHLNRTTFPNLGTLALSLAPAAAAKAVIDYGESYAAPEVSSLSLTSESDYSYLSTLASSPILGHLRLAVPVKLLAPLLSAVTTSLKTLTLTLDPSDADKDLHASRTGAETELRQVVDSPCIGGLEVFAYAGDGLTGASWFFKHLSERLEERRRSAGSSLKVVKLGSEPFEPSEWRSKTIIV